MNNMKRALSFLLMLCMLLTVLPAQALGAEQDAAAPDAGASAGSDEGDNIQKVTVEPLDPSEVSARPQVDRDFDERILTPQGNVRVIIEMEADPILTIGLYGANAEAQAAYIRNQQEEVIERIEDEVLDGEELDVRYNYSTLLNGVATQVPAESLNAIRQVEGVARVTVQQVYEPLADEVSGTIATTALSDALDQEIAGIVPDSDDLMVNAEGAWAEGYKGEGLRIAVIDTGIDVDHASFAEMDTDKWEYEVDLLDKDEIAKVLPTLNAKKNYDADNVNKPGLTADDVYHGNKIPFAFNYIDVNYNRVGHDYDSQGDHGTHVSGIAAANYLPEKTTVVGVAPNAQLMTFKVFGEAGGAYTEDIVAALEDAVKLGADVVNMSLGTNGGLRSSGDDAIDKVYASLEDAGIILATAGGNSYTAGLYNNWGDNKSLTTDIDNGIISSPASYPNATSVASVTNSEINDYYIEIGGQRFTYTNGSTADGTASPNPDLNTIGNKEYEVAVVDNMGQTADDFKKADVFGKIAIVSRGITAFTAKGELADAAGAVALIVYNNEEGSMGMDMSAFEGDIPVVLVTKKVGEMILAAHEADPTAKMFVSASTGFVNTYEGGEASDFSSWGPLSSLHLEPDIAAPGGGIYSTRNNGNYGQMSGTSMASPNLAGVAALVKQYVMEQGLTGSRLFARVNQLLMSTSQPQIYSTNGLYYSPRQQGSGLAKAGRAVTTTGYITVTDSAGNPKSEVEAELFDNPDGRFKFTFTVHNTHGEDNYYNIHTQVQTEGVSVNENLPGLYFMSGLPELLDADVTVTSSGLGDLTYDFDSNGKADSNDAQWLNDHLEDAKASEKKFLYDVDGSGEVNADDVQRYLDILTEKYAGAVDGQLLKVPANGSVTVTVEIQVTREGKAWLDKYFPKGGYVEGFMMLDSVDGGVDLSMPYMGYCGDWTAPNMYEEAMFWDDEDDPNAPITSTDANTVWFMVDGNYTVPGLNPYVGEDVEPYDRNNIAVSPNNDGNADLIEDIYLYLMRNAEYVSVYFKDEDGRILNNKYTSDKGNVAYAVPKSNYSSSYGMITPFVSSWYFDTYQFINPDTGDTLPDGTHVTLEVSAKLPYGGDKDNIYTWTIPITVDTKAPEVMTDEAHAPYITEKNGRQYLTVTFTDSVNIAAAFITNSSGTVVRQNHIWTIDKSEFKPGEPYTVTYDVTGCGNTFCLGLGDYGYNESFYKMTTTSNDPEVDYTQLYGYRVGDSDHLLQSGGYDDHVYGWMAIDPETGDITEQCDDYWVDYAINAAEYYGGYVVAILYSGEVVAIRPGYWDERMPVSEINVTNAEGCKVVGYRELAFNPTDTDCLYIMLEMTDAKGVAGTYLGTLDIESGRVTLCTSAPSSGGGTGPAFPHPTAGGFPIPGGPGTGGSTGNKVPTPTGSNIRVMAFDDDGILFGVTADMSGKNQLVVIDTEDGQIEETICELDETVGAHMGDFASSMTWYQGALYLTFMAQDDGKLVKIVPTYNEEEDGYTAEITVVSDLAADASFEGLLSLETRSDFMLDLDRAPDDITMVPSELRLLPGNNANVKVIPDPWYANVEGLEWSCEDIEGTDVVSVNPNSGDIRTLSPGKARVTATMKDPEGDEITAICTITVVKPNSSLKGYINSEGVGQYNGQWVSFNADKPKEFKKETNYSFFELSSAERVGDYIYAYNNYTRTLYRFDATAELDDTGNYPYVALDWGNSEYGIVIDLAYNYADGGLYGLRLTASQDRVDLIQIDMLSGKQSESNVVTDLRLNGSAAAALTFDNGGTCYVVTANGTFGTVDVTTKETEVLGMTGYAFTIGAASMTMDRSTEDIYVHTWNNGRSYFLWIDNDSGRTQDMGYLLSNAAIIGLYWDPEAAYENPDPERPEVESVTVPEDVYVVAGSFTPIKVDSYPDNADNFDVVKWELTDGPIEGVTIKNGVVYVDADCKAESFTVTVTTGMTEIDVTKQVTVHVLQKPVNDLGMFITQTPDIHGHIWARFDLADLDRSGVQVNSSDTFIGSAEYYDGKIYAYGYGETGYRAVEFKAYDPVDYMLLETHQVGGSVFPIDMTLDYTTGVMYAIGRNISEQYGAKTLYVVNMETGELLKLAEIKDDDDEDVYLVTLACDNRGDLYGIDVNSVLYKIEKDGTATLGMKLLDPSTEEGFHILPDESHRKIIYMQSMTFDQDTNNLYWSYVGNREVQVQGDTIREFESKLIYIDVDEAAQSAWTYTCAELGIISMTGAEGVGLHVVPETKKLPENPELCGLALDATKVILMEGDQVDVAAYQLPFGSECTITWKSDNDAVATVQNGVITAAGPGKTNITATASHGNTSIERTVEVIVASKDDMFIVTDDTGWTTNPIYASNEKGDLSGKNVFLSVSHDLEEDTWYAVDDEYNLWRFEDASLTEGKKLVEDIMENVPYSIEKRTGINSYTKEEYFTEGTPISYVDFEVYDGTVYLMVSGISTRQFNYQNGVITTRIFPTYIFELDISEAEDGILEEDGYSKLMQVASLSTCTELTIIDGRFYVLDTGDNSIAIYDEDSDTSETLVTWDKSQYDQRADIIDEETGEVQKHFGTGMAYSETMGMLYVVGYDESNYSGIVIFEIDPHNGEWRVVNGKDDHVLIDPQFYDIVIVGKENLEEAKAAAAAISLEGEELVDGAEDSEAAEDGESQTDPEAAQDPAEQQDPSEQLPAEQLPAEGEPTGDAPVEDEPAGNEPVEDEPEAGETEDNAGEGDSSDETQDGETQEQLPEVQPQPDTQPAPAPETDPAGEPEEKDDPEDAPEDAEDGTEDGTDAE